MGFGRYVVSTSDHVLEGGLALFFRKVEGGVFDPLRKHGAEAWEVRVVAKELCEC